MLHSSEMPDTSRYRESHENGTPSEACLPFLDAGAEQSAGQGRVQGHLGGQGARLLTLHKAGGAPGWEQVRSSLYTAHAWTSHRPPQGHRGAGCQRPGLGSRQAAEARAAPGYHTCAHDLGSLDREQRG